MNMALNSEMKLLEKCRVAPPPDAVAELTLPLTFYDLQWLVLPPSQHLHFYRFIHPKPTSDFIISSLKSSLSVVLKHFIPLAGNLICPVDSDGMPELRYLKGDSVSLTFAESNEDFDYLAGDHQRDSYKFHKFLPQLPEPVLISGSEISPVYALQVTLFSNSGISIGRSFLHVLGDASTFMNFNKLWASIDKFNRDSLMLLSTFSQQPLYDRSMVQDPFNIGPKIFNKMKLLKTQLTPRIPNLAISNNEVRGTFIIHRSDIMMFKKFILTKNPSFVSINVSTFTMTCALVWTCLSKSLSMVDDKVEKDKLENLCVYINCRQRFDPPIPQNYFGNCVVPCMVGSTREKLTESEGLMKAYANIENAIHNRILDREGILRGDWMSHTQTTEDLVQPGMLVIIGSIQKNDYNYNIDFNWGTLEKHECVSIDSSSTLMLIALSKRFEGALELGISLPKNRMDAFTTIFTNSINTLHMKSSL